MKKILAITANGLEQLLADELTELGISDYKLTQAGVFFKADMATVYRCCLWSRIASRFVEVLSEFDCRDDMDLYLSTSSVTWSKHFSASKTFVVDFNGTNREIRNSQYGAMKVKDAIVDHFEKVGSRRPSINKDQPDLRVHCRLHKEKGLIGLDLVGGGLHHRGYRLQSGRAPLRETLAAAIITRSAWQKGQPLLDPMCGSGTLLLEAAMVACDMAPSVNREQWCFESYKDFDYELWAEIKSEAKVKARKGIKACESTFYGVDMDSYVIKTARDNARRAGLDSLVDFQVGDATKVEKPAEFEQGVIVCNPPYGERLASEPGLIALYTELGVRLKQQFSGHKVSLFSSSEELLSCVGMRADKQFKMSNGALRCHLKNYSISETAAKQIADKQGQATEAPIVAAEFANRLKKNIGKIAKWAKKEQLQCYRLYDADLPNYNVAIDRYDDHLVIQEYAAPKTVPEETAKRRLTEIVRATIAVTGTPANNVVLKVREKQKGRSQYQKLSTSNHFMVVQEYGVKLRVNLHDYLDTGLFLDHKFTRKRLGEMASGKSFLNLFAYTGSATVHAAAGGAKSTTTVDMSNTYLNWAQENMSENGFKGKQHQFVQADCLKWLAEEQGQYDLIFIDPPTFSNSKRMEQTFDVQRDHIALMTDLKRILSKDGTLVFSNNKRQFKMDLDGLKELGLVATNISSQTLPLDFARNKHIHNCWIITHAQ
jgi:23S rRNA (guanine2445-N2)-methyltransferase / 23S rRNA (guanine2069-N7)-methyltransferase